MNTLEGAPTKKVMIAHGNASIQADSNGALPTRIELLKAGTWRTPYHGDFMISGSDLTEIASHFAQGTGLADGGNAGAPIDFSHNNEDQAAAWIKTVEVAGDTLFGNIEWTDAGKQAVKGGMFKFFSPEFYPKGRGGWQDPEDFEHYVDNVLTGGGLTNIPLFKTLGAIKASNGSVRASAVNIEFINTSEIKETSMDLETLRAKTPETWTPEEKQFVTEHKAELTEDEQVQLGFKEAPVADVVVEDNTNKTQGVETVAEQTVEEKQTAEITASIKNGTNRVIASAEYDELVKAKNDFNMMQASGKVSKHVERGAIKADAAQKWAERLVKDESLEDLLTSLPSHAVMASEIGSSEEALSKSAGEEIREKAGELVKAASGKLSIGNAMSQVMRDEPKLAERYNEEIKG